MKPQNDIELAEYISDVVQSANRLNTLVREGRLYQACALLSRIERAADKGQERINQLVDLAG